MDTRIFFELVDFVCMAGVPQPKAPAKPAVAVSGGAVDPAADPAPPQGGESESDSSFQMPDV